MHHAHDAIYTGIIPRCLDLIFAKLDDRRRRGCTVTCHVRLLEIYNEQIIDLFSADSRPLQLRENPLTSTVYVEGATEKAVDNVQDTLKLVQVGALRRTVAATACNDHSSRSHCILTLHLEAEETLNGSQVLRTSDLHLVDLAGSERQQRAKSVGLRLREASNINKSLAALGNVILHLAEGHKHIPYRDSKLTFLLRNSIGGNSKTLLVANVSAEASALSETVSTLKFASFATKSQLLVTRNQTLKDPDVAALENEVRRLHAVIAAGRQETLIMHEDDVGGAADARPLAVEQSAVAVDADAMPDHEEDKITIKRLQVLVCRCATLATRNNTHKRTRAHAHMHYRCSCGKHANGRRSFVTSCCASVPAFAPKATSTRACATPSRARSKQPEKACPSTPLSRTCCPMRSWRLRFGRPRPTALQTGMPRLRKATSSCRPG